jgi:hypothetical protein
VAQRTVNLVFCVHREEGTIADFREIAHRIEARTNDIAAHVLIARQRIRSALYLLAFASRRPTVTIEMDGIKSAFVPRGRRLRHRMPGKLAEVNALTAVGVPVPRTVPILPGSVLDPAEWGPYVVVKPIFGRRGAFVRIRRTGRVRFEDPAALPPDHPGRRGMIAQQFVHTGHWPESHRVVTYFGRVVWALRFSGRRDLPPLEGPMAFNRGGGHSIVAPARGAAISMVHDSDILEIARSAHAAFPDVPALATDVIRESGTGKLFVLETNPYGRSWWLASYAGRRAEREFGLDLHGQFDALNVITEASIEVARKHAL